MSRTRILARFAAFISLLLLGVSQPGAAQVPPTLLLPSGALNQTSMPGVTVILSSNYSLTNVQFLATFDSVPSGYSIGNSTYTAWCVDLFSDFASNPPYTLISTYDSATLSSPPGGGIAQNANWNAINWVLNNKPVTGDAPSWIVQQVIWKLLAGQYLNYNPEGPYPSPAPGAQSPLSAGDTTIANTLYANALAQTSFVPGLGQTVGVMLYVDGIDPDGSAFSNAVVADNNINPVGPPLEGPNGQPNQVQEMLIEVTVAGPTVTCSAVSSGEVGVPFNSPAATVLGGSAPYTFSIANGGTLPAGLTLDASTGAITGTPTAPGSFMLQVTDANGYVGTGNCSFTIVAGPSVTCSAVNSGEVGVPFNSPALNITGGVAPYTFSVASGSLPPGLTLDTSTGAITGTPTAPGTFTIRATDKNGVVTTVTCSYTIGSAPSLTCAATSMGDVGVPFDSGPATVTGGTQPFTFSIATGSLPTGLSLNSSTGEITGTPMAMGTFTLKVTDANNIVALGTCPFSIVGLPTITTGACSYSGEVGLPFSSPSLISLITGGVAPFTFSVVGTLPAGLTLNTMTGAVTGTPTASGSFTIQATDADNKSITVPCPFTIAPPPSLTCSAVTSGEVGVPFNSPAPTVNGGTAPFLFSVVGTLPAGLILNPATGAITGTPTAPGTFSIQVKDLNNIVSTTTCPYTIIAGPSLTCSAVTSGEVGAPFSSTPTVSGGTGPYTFSIATGSLPAGLSLNSSTGAITGTPTAAGTFTIQVKDSNGVVATGTCPYTIIGGPSLTCSAVTSGEVGAPFSSTPSVSGGTGPYTFSIATGSLPAGLSLNNSTGAITGTPTATGTFTIQVKDSNGVVATGTCPYTIIAGPSLTCSAVTSGEVGAPFSSTPTVSGGTGPYTFSIATGSLPAGLSLNSSTGAITGTPTAAGTFTIQVKDSNGVVATGTCPYTIIAGPSLTCSIVSSGEVGVAFSSTPSVTGGTGPYTFAIATGSLPAGLSLNSSTGAITGTPTAAGTFTIKVTDSKGVVATGTCPYTIIAGPSLTCSAVSSGEVGVAFSSTPSVTGGTGPYTFSIATGSLPGGLSLNSSTGAITGTPTAAGTFTIQVKDSNGVVAIGTCPYTIIAGPSLTCSAVSSGEVGVAFSSTPSVTGGTGPYTFSIATGSLPAGLSLNSSTGAITGTPTAAGAFTIKVTDSKGVVATGTCPYTIIAGPSLTCSAVTSGEAGVAFSSTPSVTGGTAPYTFAIATGSLPAGLSLNSSTGAITGTPTAAGTFTIKVTDSKGVVATGTCPYTIVVGPSLTCSSVTTGEVGMAFSSPALTVTGGTGPYTFAIGSGTLPAGLSLNASTGAVTGTPTATGTFTIKVTDAKGVVATTTCGITISPKVSLTCGTCSGNTANGTVGHSYSTALQTSGGVGPYTYSITSGSLPPGLTLNTSTGAITGTPTATGTFTFTTKVTDSKGNSATATCTISVAKSPITMTCGSCQNPDTGKVGSWYNEDVSASGGSGKYYYSVISGSLPPGLSMNNSNGDITGTPTKAGTYTFTTQAMDSNGYTASTTCSIAIASH
jgi:hypothetical protein